jgi:TfoX/Sxy family transcriptional regulator of competence genes
MAEAQLRKLRFLIEGMAANLNRKDTIECKHFFSGAAAYVNGRIFMTLTTAGLALKLPQDSRELLMGNGARPLRYFPKGPIKKDYVLVPRALVNDEARLAPRIRESIRFAQTFTKAISPRAGYGSAKATRGLPP